LPLFSGRDRYMVITVRHFATSGRR
jgi:hypothetical protein